MYKYNAQVPQHVPAITLGGYVRRAFPLLPESALRSAFDRRDVKMDGKRCGKGEKVVPGSVVTVFTEHQAMMPIAYEDTDVLAVDKPAGVSCDADAYGSMTVLDWAQLYARDEFCPRMCHRLDNPTSGLLLLAKNDQAEKVLTEMFAAHTGQKSYCCIVAGRPKIAHDTCSAWLTKDAARGVVRVSSQEGPQAKRIETEYEVIQGGALSLLRVSPHTGRTHQIRAHMAFMGHPLLGDDLYGDRALNRQYGAHGLMLRSVSIRIETRGALPQLDGKVITVQDIIDRCYNNLIR